MKPLETEFDFNQFHFKQIRREGDLAIYEQWKHGRIIAWEVIRVQSHNGRQFGEKWYDPAEFYPCANSWGTLGWTCTSLEDANKRFESIQEQAKLAL